MISERNSGWKQPRDTVYLYCEGFSTEYYYFKKIEGARRRVFPDTKYLLKPVRRDLSKMGKSSPKDVLIQLARDKTWRELVDRCHIDTFLTKYLNAVAITNNELRRDLYPNMENNEDRFNPEFDRFFKLYDELYNLLDQLNVIGNDKLVDIRKTKKIADLFMEVKYPDYEIDFDIEEHLFPVKVEGNEHYAMVVDRDQFSKTRTDEVMQHIRNQCGENDHILVVTNPYFELWLAMHTQDYDKDDMEAFVRSYYELFSSRSKTTREQRESVGPTGYLKKHTPGYDKKLSNCPYLDQEGLERAIKNLRTFYKTDLEEVLKKITADDLSSIGSNILDIIGN